jgi:transcriptional regulator with XRE-family HTH domain
MQTKKRNALGARIRELREARGLSLDAVAALVGVSSSHLSRMERDLTAPSFTLIGRIAEALGVGVVELDAFDRVHADERACLVAALIAREMDVETAGEIVRAIAPTARQALLAAMER